MTLGPELERQLLSVSKQREAALSLLSPADFESLFSQIAAESDRLVRRALVPVLLCAAPLRRVLRNLLLRASPHLHIVSIDEVAYHARVVSAAVITFDSKNLKEAA
jgi:flagellar biosynthesis protein FlhA